MKIETIEKDMPVVYIPQYKLGNKNINDDQLGIVTSKNDTYVFVRYKNTKGSQATRPDDLYTIEFRPDLQERLGIEVKPINRVCELYIAEKLINP